MKPRACLILWLGLSFLLAIFAAGVWIVVTEPWKPRVRMPDGTEIVLEAVTHGKVHEFDPAPWWRRPFLNANRRARPGEFRVIRESTSQDTLTVWTRVRHGPRPMFPPSGALMWVLRDEHGCLFMAERRVGLGPRPSRNAPAIEWAQWPGFAHRSGRLWLEASSWRQGGRPLASFEIPSRLRKASPAWQPASVPSTARVDALSVTLKSWRRGRDGTGGRPIVGARLQARDVRNPTWGWSNWGGELTDALGNSSRRQPFRSPDSELWLMPLCFNEPAWRLGVDFVPESPYSMPPDAQWEFPPLSLSSPRPVLGLGWQKSVGGVRLQVLRLAPPGEFRSKNDRGLRDHDPAACVRLSSRHANTLLRLVTATDDQGRSLRRIFDVGPTNRNPAPADLQRSYQSESAGEWQYGSRRDYHFLLQPYPNSRTVKLSFAAWHSRRVEFTVAPPVAE